MSSKYLPVLIQIAQEELPQLQYTLENSSTVLALQEATKRLHNIVTYLVHHTILSDPTVMAEMNARQARPMQPRHVAPQPQQYQVPPGFRLVPDVPAAPMVPTVGSPPAPTYYPHSGQVAPALPIAPAAVGELPIIPMAAPGAPTPSGGHVADVTITRTGTRVVTPAGAMTLPPGVPVDATGGQAVPEGVILPPGGAMTPEMEAALAAARSTPPPPARNITHEQPQG